MNVAGKSRRASKVVPSTRWQKAVVTCLLLGACTFLTAAEAPKMSLRQRHLAQQQARALAAQLVSDILDIQLRQLKENGLENLPAYADIEAMRGNLDRLVDQDMQAVVALLMKAEAARDNERQTAILEARTKGRAVVVALLAEQQRLRQRMRLANIAAQAQQLIALESHVVADTQQLSEKPPADREQATLELLENQRDIATLHTQLTATLRELVNWEGSISATSTKSLEVLTKRQVDQELKNADTALAKNQLPAAEKAGSAAIKAWKELLQVIEEAQGLLNSNSNGAIKAIDALMQKQSQLRDETKASKLDDPSQAEKLAEEQHGVQDELNQLLDQLPQNPSSESLLKQAADAAFEAEGNLFEGKQQSAIQQQDKVIHSLAELTKQVEQQLAEMRARKPNAESEPFAEKNQQATEAEEATTSDQAKSSDLTTKASSSEMQASKTSDQAAKSAQKDTGESSEQASREQGNPMGGKQSPGESKGSGEVSPAQRSVEVEPWFAKLPPDVQKAIQARARRRAPRGYEERLKRYFESN